MILDLKRRVSGQAVQVRCEECQEVRHIGYSSQLGRKTEHLCASCAAKKDRQKRRDLGKFRPAYHHLMVDGRPVFFSEFARDPAIRQALGVQSIRQAYDVINNRLIRLGWPPERALSESIYHRRKEQHP